MFKLGRFSPSLLKSILCIILDLENHTTSDWLNHFGLASQTLRCFQV